LAQVPGNVDLLVAGTSCVDYSNLNNEKQDLDANGESGRTFRGMMSWVTAHRPPVVILENVCSAPWDRVKKKFEMEGYSATYLRLDTKQFYIPHTRTRVYLFAVNKRSSSKITDKWEELIVNKLKRPASASLDSFLLASDDPRIQQSREKLVQEIARSADRKSGRTDWARCQSRHERTRLEMELGAKRPLTGWDEGNPSFWHIGSLTHLI
jgi:site-specific DNA-cytosine methylase